MNKIENINNLDNINISFQALLRIIIRHAKNSVVNEKIFLSKNSDFTIRLEIKTGKNKGYCIYDIATVNITEISPNWKTLIMDLIKKIEERKTNENISLGVG